MSIEYKINTPISVEQFLDVLHSSTLAERRPVEDLECLKGMLDHADLIVSAWEGGELVGIARSITDFHSNCYLADLAVSKQYQKTGVGKKLQILTQEQLGPKCGILLIAAPAAKTYYEKLGYTFNDRCWAMGRDAKIG